MIIVAGHGVSTRLRRFQLVCRPYLYGAVQVEGHGRIVYVLAVACHRNRTCQREFLPGHVVLVEGALLEDEVACGIRPGYQNIINGVAAVGACSGEYSGILGERRNDVVLVGIHRQLNGGAVRGTVGGCGYREHRLVRIRESGPGLEVDGRHEVIPVHRHSHALVGSSVLDGVVIHRHAAAGFVSPGKKQLDLNAVLLVVICDSRGFLGAVLAVPFDLSLSHIFTVDLDRAGIPQSLVSLRGTERIALLQLYHAYRDRRKRRACRIQHSAERRRVSHRKHQRRCRERSRDFISDLHTNTSAYTKYTI